jgi:Cu(I)-responsive transcriptional regulator
MNIGAAAKATGISAKMIRYYEDIGLLSKPARSSGGYRTYSTSEIHSLRFIRQARELGFSTQQVAELLSLWNDKSRPSHKAKAITTSHIASLEEKIHKLEAMKKILSELASCCHGDGRPECPILDGIAHPMEDGGPIQSR